MPGVREEVAAGIIEQSFLDFARAAARRVTGSRPTPTGSYDWTDDDIDDLVFDTVARVRPDQIVLRAAQAANDRQFRAWLIKAMRTTVDLRARDTPAGKVIKAVDTALSADPDRFSYNKTTGCWHRADDARAPGWSDGARPLIAAAWAVPTSTVTLAETATKTGRLARRRDIRAVAHAVLNLSGPIPKPLLGEVMAHRFNAYFIDRYDYLEALGDDVDVAAPQDITDEDADVQVDDAAQWMLEQLTGEERDLLTARVAGGSYRSIAEERGWKKHRLEKLNARLEQKILRLCAEIGGESDEAAAAMLRIVGHEDASRHSTDQDDSDPDGI